MKNIFKFVVLVLSLMLLLCNSGCGLDANNVDGSSNKTVQDYRGKRIVLKNKPKRIISTFYVGDEILYGVADKANVLAYSQWAHDEKISFITEQTKEYTLNPPKVTEFYLKNNVDLVLAHEGLSPDFIASIEAMGINVYVYKVPNSIEEIRTLIKNIADLIGEKQRGKLVVEQMDKDLKNVADLEQPKEAKTVALLAHYGVIGAKNTISDVIFKRAGLANTAAKASKLERSTLPKEMLLKLNPEYIFLVDWTYGGRNPSGTAFLKEVMSDPSLQTLQAVKNKNVIPVPVKYNCCASQYIGKAILQTRNYVYPISK